MACYYQFMLQQCEHEIATWRFFVCVEIWRQKYVQGEGKRTPGTCRSVSYRMANARLAEAKSHGETIVTVNYLLSIKREINKHILACFNHRKDFGLLQMCYVKRCGNVYRSDATSVMWSSSHTYRQVLENFVARFQSLL